MNTIFYILKELSIDTKYIYITLTSMKMTEQDKMCGLNKIN